MVHVLTSGRHFLLQGLKGLQAVVDSAAPSYESAREAVWKAAAAGGSAAAPPPIADLSLGPWLRTEVGKSMDGVKHVSTDPCIR